MQEAAAGTGAVVEVGGLRARADIVFTDKKGAHKKGIEKRQRGLLEKVGSFAKPFLAADEQILLVTTACSPISLLEQFLTGWIVFYIKQCLLVFTDRRVLHVPTAGGYRYRDSIAAIPYRACAELRLRGGVLKARYGDGRSEKFLYVNGRERAKLKVLLPSLVSEGAVAEPGAGRRHLCPRCTAPLEPKRYQCPSCQLAFKSRAEARKLALLFPGGGYFYTRHHLLGLGDAATELLLLVMVVFSLVMYLGGNEWAVVNVVMFGLALVFEKWVSVFHSNHFVDEYIPVEQHIRPLADGQA